MVRKRKIKRGVTFEVSNLDALHERADIPVEVLARATRGSCVRDDETNLERDDAIGPHRERLGRLAPDCESAAVA